MGELRCGRCGGSMEADDAYCPICGVERPVPGAAGLVVAEGAAVPGPAIPRSWAFAAIVTAVVLALIAAFSIAVLSSSDDDKVPNLGPAGEAVAEEWADEIVRDFQADGLPIARAEALCMGRLWVDHFGPEIAASELLEDQRYLGSDTAPSRIYEDGDARALAETAGCFDNPTDFVAAQLRLSGALLDTSSLECVAARIAGDLENLLYAGLSGRVLEAELISARAQESCGLAASGPGPAEPARHPQDCRELVDGALVPPAFDNDIGFFYLTCQRADGRWNMGIFLKECQSSGRQFVTGGETPGYAFLDERIYRVGELESSDC